MSSLELPSRPATPALAAAGVAESGVPLAAWSRITVGSIDVRPLHEGDVPRASVEACVSLGTILPVDVRVELVPSATAHAADAHRMFSAQAFDGGTCRFEVALPVAELERFPDWSVRVLPADWSGPYGNASPAERWFSVPAAGVGAVASPGHLLPCGEAATTTDAPARGTG